MNAPRSVLVIGLTGGIASGKSTVAECFRERGAFVVDLDRVAHETMEPGGSAYRNVVERFGESILADDGSGRIDRAKLGPIVFAKPRDLNDLNAIVHPEVRREWRSRVEQFAASGDGPRVAVIEAALLVESGQHEDLDGLVVVHCSPRTQLERLIARDRIGEAAARQRIDAQAPPAAKLAAATWTIDTDGTLDQTLAAAHRTFDELEARIS